MSTQSSCSSPDETPRIPDAVGELREDLMSAQEEGEWTAEEILKHRASRDRLAKILSVETKPRPITPKVIERRRQIVRYLWPNYFMTIIHEDGTRYWKRGRR